METAALERDAVIEPSALVSWIEALDRPDAETVRAKLRELDQQL